MLAQLFSMMAGSVPPVKRFFWRQCYQFLAGYHQECGWKFMNYGYLGPAGPELLEEDEADRLGIQLYHHVTRPVDLEGRSVLEVSSGRGGGCSFVKRYLGAGRVVGLDFSVKAVQLSRHCHPLEGLSFRSGDAERLPFSDDCFDAVLNVEASHCYGSMEAFLSHTARVLRRGGHLLLADFRTSPGMDLLRRQLSQSGLTLIQEKDITENVLRALIEDDERKREMIRQSAPPWLRHSLCEFAGLKGSRIFESFRKREKVYFSFALCK